MNEIIEKFSVVKTLQAIKESHVSVFIVDATESLTEQDFHLIGFIFLNSHQRLAGPARYISQSGRALHALQSIGHLADLHARPTSRGPIPIDVATHLSRLFQRTSRQTVCKVLNYGSAGL